MTNKKFFLQNIILISIATCVMANEANQKEIEALEKEKADLLKKIYSAIDDSVTLLHKDNDTQNLQGINYMLQLKHQIENLNETEAENVDLMQRDSNSTLENRRNMGERHFGFQKATFRSGKTTTIDKSFDVKQILINKDLTAQQIKDLMKNREAMQKRLDDWIMQREIEKAKIRERYLLNKKLMQHGLLEKCPRYGIGKENKRYRRQYEIMDTQDVDNKLRSGGKKKPKIVGKKYPCCRKCCKNSYLGCL